MKQINLTEWFFLADMIERYMTKKGQDDLLINLMDMPNYSVELTNGAYLRSYMKADVKYVYTEADMDREFKQMESELVQYGGGKVTYLPQVTMLDLDDFETELGGEK